MKKLRFRSVISWNSLLIVSVFFSAFILPVFPASWGMAPVSIAFSAIYLSGVMSLDRQKRFILYFTGIVFLLHWISGMLEWWVIADFSRALNMIFFVVIVASLIRQMAGAKNVTARVIMEAITGYILLGITASVLITAIIQQDSGAFNIPQPAAISQNSVFYLSESTYFSFVTLATLGLGDIVPLKPYSRSLTTIIAIAGQLYITIIIAMLVGKFASQDRDSEK
jgi:voltage-gated potassium channel